MPTRALVESSSGLSVERAPSADTEIDMDGSGDSVTEISDTSISMSSRSLRSVMDISDRSTSIGTSEISKSAFDKSDMVGNSDRSMIGADMAIVAAMAKNMRVSARRAMIYIEEEIRLIMRRTEQSVNEDDICRVRIRFSAVCV